MDKNVSERVMTLWLTLSLQDLLDLINVLISCYQERLITLTTHSLVFDFFRFHFNTMTCSFLMAMLQLSL